MNWKDRIKNIELSITTGDGKVWKPLWRKAKRDIEYNVSGFEAIDIEGTFVERKKKKGEKYPITFYFTGEDCIEVANAFEQSARDSRPWIVKHPYFNKIKVQPFSLELDYSDLNAVRVTGTLWETISRKYPQEVIIPSSQISLQVEDLNASTAANFVAEVNPPLSGNIEPAQDFISTYQSIQEKLAQSQDEIAEVKELARQASGAAQNMISDITRFIEYNTNLIIFPIQLKQGVRLKIDAMIEAARSLAAVFIGVTGNNSLNDKNNLFYEAHINILLGAFSEMLVNSTYNDVTDVLYAIDSLSDIYAEVLSNFDEIIYLQDATNALNLDVIINSTLANLYDIAFDAKQQRIIILGEDSNIVLLAHKYYGRGDDKLDEFIQQNKIKADEYLQVKKGRKITYYI